MANLFRKHLNNKFGKMKYRDYVESGKAFLLTKEQDVSKSQVYHDMYKDLEYQELDYLVEDMDRLLQTIINMCNVGKRFSVELLYFVFMSGILWSLELNAHVAMVAFAMMGCLMIGKTVNYLSNKFCYVDVYLIMTYRAVLDTLIDSKNH